MTILIPGRLDRLARIFRTLRAGSGDPAYRDWPGAVADRVPSRGEEAPIQALCEMFIRGARNSGRESFAAVEDDSSASASSNAAVGKLADCRYPFV